MSVQILPQTFREIERRGRIQSALQRKQQPTTAKDLWALARHWQQVFERTQRVDAQQRAERFLELAKGVEA